MISARKFIFGYFFLLLSTPFALADGVPFSVPSSSIIGADANDTQGLTTKMKIRAVLDWIQRNAPDRVEQYEKQVNADFADKYILDYKLSRSATNKGQFELTGRLDADALKRWLRIAESKSQTSSVLKSFLVFSSSVSGFSVSPGDTTSQVKESNFGQALYTNLSSTFQRFNASVSTVDRLSGLPGTPGRSDEIRGLQEVAQQGGFNSAVWCHLSPCKNCAGGKTKLDCYLYHLTTGRLVVGHTEELTLDSADFAQGDRVRKEVKEAIGKFTSAVEEALSAGLILTYAHRIYVEGIDNYRAFKAVEGGLGHLDFISQALVKRNEPNGAEFEVLTTLGREEFFQRMHLASFSGFQLKPVKIDPQSMIVRYLK